MKMLTYKNQKFKRTGFELFHFVYLLMLILTYAIIDLEESGAMIIFNFSYLH